MPAVLIGLESPTAAALAGRSSAHRKAYWAAGYAAAIRGIQSHGITVNGCFILGLDGHTKEIFQQVQACAEAWALFDVQITLLMPFPGTPLDRRLLDAGRLMDPDAWHLCTLLRREFSAYGDDPAGTARRHLLAQPADLQ